MALEKDLAGKGALGSKTKGPGQEQPIGATGTRQIAQMTEKERAALIAELAILDEIGKLTEEMVELEQATENRSKEEALKCTKRFYEIDDQLEKLHAKLIDGS